MPEALSPDRLESLLTAGGEPRSVLERDALAMARRLGYAAVPGPSAPEAGRLAARFDAFLARGGRPMGLAGLLPGWLAAPIAQRLAAAAVLLGGLSAGSSALGYTPIDAARDTGAVVKDAGDLAANIVRNLNPNRGEGGGGFSPDATLTPTTTVSASQTPGTPVASDTPAASQTPAVSETPSPEPTPGPADGIQTVFAGEAGSADIRQAGALLEVVSVAPLAGWEASIVTPSGPEVVVRFTSGTRSVELKVDLEDGRLDPEIEVDHDTGDDDSGANDDEEDDSSGPGSDD